MEKTDMNKNIYYKSEAPGAGLRKISPKRETVLINLETELRSILNPNIQVNVNTNSK
jgi:hypothetical protein